MIEALKSGTAWPSWAAVTKLLNATAWPVVVLFLVLAYRKEIRALFAQVSELGPGGAKFQAHVQDTGIASEPASELSSAEIEEAIGDPVMAQFETHNWRAFQGLDSADRDKKLIRALTVEQMNRYFALAYANMFGSQIRVLRTLNARDINRAEAEAMFEGWQQQNPHFSSWSLDQYLNYFVVWHLAEQSEGLIRITPTGRNFLRFLTDFRLSEDRLN